MAGVRNSISVSRKETEIPCDPGAGTQTLWSDNNSIIIICFLIVIMFIMLLSINEGSRCNPLRTVERVWCVNPCKGLGL